MRGRPILLVLGTLALAAGAALVVFQLQAPAPTAVEVVAKVDSQAVLVMARPVKSRSLLRPDDLAWKAIAIAAVPTGAYPRGTATEGDFAGAVVRKDLPAGAVLTAEDVVKAGEPGFLPAVLNDGMRATSIAVGLAEGASGLIVPGDHVDVVLIQNFTEAGVELSHRSVGETVLSDLRVIAIDQRTTTDAKPKGPEPAAGTAAAAAAATAAAVEPRIAKTVTLEVTVHQAEVLDGRPAAWQDPAHAARCRRGESTGGSLARRAAAHCGATYLGGRRLAGARRAGSRPPHAHDRQLAGAAAFAAAQRRGQGLSRPDHRKPLLRRHGQDCDRLRDADGGTARPGANRAGADHTGSDASHHAGPGDCRAGSGRHARQRHARQGRHVTMNAASELGQWTP